MSRVQTSFVLFILYFLLVFVFHSVSSEHYANLSRISSSGNRRTKHRPHKDVDSYFVSRTPKLLSFNAVDDDITVDLEFGVPFLHVPIKKTMEATSNSLKSLVNLNISALVVSGLFIVIGAGFGLLFNSFVGKTTGIRRKSRISDIPNFLSPVKVIYKGANGEQSETALDNWAEMLERKFAENNVDVTACVQKSICSFVKRIKHQVQQGHGTGTNKIIDGLLSSDWFLYYLEGSAARDAIDAGISVANTSSDCGHRYITCKWSRPEYQMKRIILEFLSLLPNRSET